MKNKGQQAIIFFGVATAIVLLDQLTKALVKANLGLNQKVVLIPNLLNIAHVQNTGAGFGLFKEFSIFLLWISVIVAGFILYYYPSISKDKKIFYLCSFILGGTVGNLIDRLLIGAVTDFIDFRSGSLYFPTFNIADACISLSAIGLMFILWNKDKKEKIQTKI